MSQRPPVGYAGRSRRRPTNQERESSHLAGISGLGELKGRRNVGFDRLVAIELRQPGLPRLVTVFRGRSRNDPYQWIVVLEGLRQSIKVAATGRPIDHGLGPWLTRIAIAEVAVGR